MKLDERSLEVDCKASGIELRQGTETKKKTIKHVCFKILSKHTFSLQYLEGTQEQMCCGVVLVESRRQFCRD